VQVSLLPGSEALSLQGGRLYKTELKPAGTLAGATRAAGTVEGPVFINMIGVSQPDVRTGYVLGGGRVGYEYQGAVTLRKGDFLVASRIRNRLNDRYGPGTSDALSPAVIGIRIPADYRQRKLRFLAMVGATYLDQTPDLAEARMNFYARQLAVSDRKEHSEAALEALGRQCVGKLASLLKSSDEEVRLRVARCVLNLGDDRGFGVLRDIALDVKSSRRLEALEAIVEGGERNDAIILAERLLGDPDSAIVLGAYEHLRQMGASSVDEAQVAAGFYVEQVALSVRKAVYVTRSGDPRVVLFGAPLVCRNSLFVESPDKMVVINAQPGQQAVSLLRQHPTRQGMIGPVPTSFNLADVARTLGGDPVLRKDGGLSGLGVSYSEVAVLMERLVDKGGVQAEFLAGPLPKLGLIIKK
jgi:hypothetical protein